MMIAWRFQRSALAPSFDLFNHESALCSVAQVFFNKEFFKQDNTYWALHPTPKKNEKHVLITVEWDVVFTMSARLVVIYHVSGISTFLDQCVHVQLGNAH